MLAEIGLKAEGIFFFCNSLEMNFIGLLTNIEQHCAMVILQSYIIVQPAWLYMYTVIMTFHCMVFLV